MLTRIVVYCGSSNIFESRSSGSSLWYRISLYTGARESTSGRDCWFGDGAVRIISGWFCSWLSRSKSGANEIREGEGCPDEGNVGVEEGLSAFVLLENSDSKMGDRCPVDVGALASW